MSWRVRAHLAFQAGSGMAAWAEAQMAVRVTHDHDPNRQQINEERSHNTRDGDTLDVDLFLATEALAADTYATLTAASVTAWLEPDTDDAVSFVDYHFCEHDGVPAPCAVTERWTQQRP